MLKNIINKTMKAVRIHQYGGPEVLKLETDVAVPTISSKQILLQVHYAGINFIDTYQRTGLYKSPFPQTLGKEASGIVAQVGSEVTRFKVGQRVAFGVGQGAYAEYVTADQDNVVPIPDALPLDQACASMLQALTAHYLITSVHEVKPNEIVLIHAGAGGTGALMISMAKLKGATVITTVSSEEKAKIVKELGADHVIIYTQQNFKDEVLKITNGQGCHAVYDSVAATTWEGSLKCTRRRGMLCFFGNSSGPVPPFDLLQLSTNGSIFVARPTLKDFTATWDELNQRMQDIFSWVNDGKIKIRIAKKFSLEQVADAHNAIQSRNFSGKILLEVKQE